MGRQDLVIGNIGGNFYLRPNEKAPAKLWLKDFDNSGTVDAFLTRTASGRDVPVFLKREITEQFPFLKKENLRHSDYAKKSVQELFGQEGLAKAEIKTFNYCSSVVAINKGGGSFDVQPLPLHVQLSSVNAICTTDVDGDGKTDLLLGGNLFTFPPQFGRLDASYGHVLRNNGKGGFDYVPTKTAGINVKGETKDIKEIKTKKGRLYLFTQNNALPVLYRLQK